MGDVDLSEPLWMFNIYNNSLTPRQKLIVLFYSIMTERADWFNWFMRFNPDFLRGMNDSDYSLLTAWLNTAICRSKRDIGCGTASDDMAFDPEIDVVVGLLLQSMSADDKLRMIERISAVSDFCSGCADPAQWNFPNLSQLQKNKRRAIVLTALSQVGRVSATIRSPSVDNYDSRKQWPRYGWRSLHRYFSIAYGCRPLTSGGSWDSDEERDMEDLSEARKFKDGCPYPQQSKNYVHDVAAPFQAKERPNGLQHWCGIFATWAYRRSGCLEDHQIGSFRWRIGFGIAQFAGFKGLGKNERPLPGDIGYIDKPYNHHSIVVGFNKSNPDEVVTVDGNSDYKKRFAIVCSNLPELVCGSGIWLHGPENYRKTDIFYRYEGL